jgi:hypothetical protein
LQKILTTRIAAVLLVGLVGTLPAAAAPVVTTSRFVQALDSMMVSLVTESARSGAQIRGVYQEHLGLLMLAGYVDIEGALDNGGLVPLPSDARRFNLVPRLEGPHPIGEKDMENQSSYIAARPATIGMLLEIASNVKSGPLEITSLVRHGEYQESLRVTNTNATTSVPMHTMGLAVDIALVNSSLKTVYEVRDVLRRMQKNGDILFVGERRQLVFHVVPHPSRLGHFTDVYIRKVGLPPTSRSAHVVATAPGKSVKRRSGGIPQVTAETLTFFPLLDGVDAAAAAATPPTPARTAASSAVTWHGAASSAARILRRWSLLLVAMLIVSWRIAARPPVRPCLFEQRI